MEVWLGMIGLGHEEGMEITGTLEDQLDRNPKGEQSPLQIQTANSDYLYDRDGRQIHPQFFSIANWAPMGKDVVGQPLGDQIAVLQDRSRDELECKKCSGSGHSQIICRVCEGRGRYTVAGEMRDCEECICSDYDSPAFPKAAGYVPCSDCRGTGQAAAGKTMIVAKTDTTVEPSTGVILALGPDVTRFNIGDRILYSKFAGVGYECEGREWRVMKETYPIMRIKGTGMVKGR